MLEISGFGVVLLFIIGAVTFVSVTLLAGWILRPVRPNEEKNTTYESGEDPVNSAWGIFNFRFYVVALVFLLFETELVFLFPWSTVFANQSLVEETGGLWAWFSLIETFVFIGILVVGLAYVWSRGMLDWVKPTRWKSDYESRIPDSAYDHINHKTYRSHGAS